MFFFFSFPRLIWFYRLSNLYDSYFQLFLYLIFTLLRQQCNLSAFINTVTFLRDLQIQDTCSFYYAFSSWRRSMYTLKHVFQIKSIVFKIEILTCFLLCRSFWNVINNIASNSNGLLSASDIRNLEKCDKKRNKALLDINFLKNCKTLNVFPKSLSIWSTVSKQKWHKIHQETTIEKCFALKMPGTTEFTFRPRNKNSIYQI